MVEYLIDEYFEFHFNTQTPATGAAVDADALPIYRVYEENNDTVIESANCAKRDDANTTGYYLARGQCTAALGYEVGKDYIVRVAAIVGGVTGAIVVGMFRIVPADVARDDQWTDVKAAFLTAAVAIEAGGNVAAIKAKTDLIGATVALEAAGNLAAVKAKTDLIPASPAAVGSAMTLADSAITSAKFAAGAITAASIAADAIGASELAAGAAAEIAAAASDFRQKVQSALPTAYP